MCMQIMYRRSFVLTTNYIVEVIYSLALGVIDVLLPTHQTTNYCVSYPEYLLHGLRIIRFLKLSQSSLLITVWKLFKKQCLHLLSSVKLKIGYIVISREVAEVAASTTNVEQWSVCGSLGIKMILQDEEIDSAPVLQRKWIKDQMKKR